MKALVTGGGGFLGRRIVELLLERGDEVRFIARGTYAQVEALGAEAFVGDLRDPEAVQKAVDGVDAVFHVAAKAGYWGPEEEYFGINVDGTRNVLEAMERAGVPRLINTSTPSVVGYASDVENGGPDLPYAAKHENAYAASKAAAEQLVRDANGPSLATVSLRPHLIFGPGDNHLMPRVVQRASDGALPMVGDGKNRVDLTYIDNAAWAHLDALGRLEDHESVPAGKAYFISNGEPVVLWDWLNALLEELDLHPVRKKVPMGVARAIGAVLEVSYRALSLRGEPRLTRFLAAALARSHWYDMEPARRDLGYEPRVAMDEATKLTAEWLRNNLGAAHQ